MSKRYKNIKRLLLAEGWQDKTHKGHSKLMCPCGQHMIVLSLSSSDHRAAKNLEALLRRFEREGCTGIPAGV